MGDPEEVSNDLLEFLAIDGRRDGCPAAVCSLLSANVLSSAGNNEGGLHAKLHTLLKGEGVLSCTEGSEAWDKEVAIDVVGVVHDDAVNVREAALLEFANGKGFDLSKTPFVSED